MQTQDDALLKWADAFSFGPDDWCYVVINQLHLDPVLNAGADMAQPPFLIARFKGCNFKRSTLKNELLFNLDVRSRSGNALDRSTHAAQTVQNLTISATITAHTKLRPDLSRTPAARSGGELEHPRLMWSTGALISVS